MKQCQNKQYQHKEDRKLSSFFYFFLIAISYYPQVQPYTEDCKVFMSATGGLGGFSAVPSGNFYEIARIFYFFQCAAAIFAPHPPIFLWFLRSGRGCTGIFWGSQRKILRAGRLFAGFLNIVHFWKVGWGVFDVKQLIIRGCKAIVVGSSAWCQVFLQIWVKMYGICDIFEEKQKKYASDVDVCRDEK